MVSTWAGILVTAFLLVGCGTQSDASAASSASSPSRVPAPSAEESTLPASATTTASETPISLPSAGDSEEGEATQTLAVFESAVNGLQLRSGPSLTSAGFEFPCNPVGGCTERVLIDAGWTMVALAGPVVADGYEWYLVQLIPEHPGSAHIGWAATPPTGDAWLRASGYQCPAGRPDLAGAIGMGAVLLLYCYSGEELSFEGYVVTGFGCNQMGIFEPIWLAHPCANMSFISPVQDSNDDIFLHFPAPGVINPTLELDDGQRVRIQGHFDDPAAASCVMEAATEAEMDDASLSSATDVAVDVARCRLRFVMTEATVVP